ncbi:type II toxin-antitoxin system VapC family toxin [Gryllotalpicola ginsengisoli]|uniref:type II toxin-antitoxin system VapC family toxin n=1 Tax=Gryllotalpicola ginsengisoli TaxID=444608 RepID=UPI0003B44A05|nr:type II toxin-antitoxin system VapC family toxin [Gryllotalpicola ginsengisoli]
MTTYYLDTSVALRALLGHSSSAAEWIDRVSADPEHDLISSRLLRTELTRVLRREQLPVTLRDEILDVLALVPVGAGVLAAAEAIEPHVKTLDAIHLGSVIAAGLDATIVTHDAGMKAAAERLGYPWHDPVDEA